MATVNVKQMVQKQEVKLLVLAVPQLLFLRKA
jgi:hypothetical protein